MPFNAKSPDVPHMLMCLILCAWQISCEVREAGLTGFPETWPVAVSLSQVSVFERLYVNLCLPDFA